MFKLSSLPILRASGKRCLGLALAGGLTAATMAGCAPIVDTRGHMVDSDRMETVKIGQSSREQVLQSLGSPSATALFDNESWYYIGKRTETLAFFAPEVLEQQVVIIRFDNNGVVSGIDRLDKENGNEVQLVQRTTPTAGAEMTFLQQMFGNLGRFNATDNRGALPSGGIGRR
ncbi:outer membrane protein assembly factor BamE [Oceanibaculum indicum]|uniref:Outer membrane protein assembly factor BamE (Lipoprotein component of BamABCDE complex) n=1 Tax=Oceanibaculum indicum TaxID=526216 RepID=A0A420WQ98_9PROT|nr:outer membrane protein assembly factor BamE [Oceanibaculum indicum]RKQ73213.1 outer membrane protein assembly factor BamE (lipoprotein component of BamABCDE complex) [Oceanibaculum indicum]